MRLFPCFRFGGGFKASKTLSGIETQANNSIHGKAKLRFKASKTLSGIETLHWRHPRPHNKLQSL